MAGAFTVRVEGATLSGEMRGDCPALALIHGMGGDLRDWDRLVAALPADLPLLRHDLRGFGRSHATDGVEFSHSDDFLRMLDTLGIERIAVLGLSLGGAVALNFALNHPERVSRLILVSPAMVGWQWSAEWKALWREVSIAAKGGDIAQARRRWFAHPMFEALRETEAGEDLWRSISTFAGRQWLRDWQRHELPDIDRLHALATPALLLSGERDVPDMRLIADVIAASAPRVERIDFPGAGHMLHLERTNELAHAVARFIAL